MTDQRSGTDRRIDDAKRLAKEKTTTLSGGNNSYYLTDLGSTVVETEDIIETLEMSFALATTFKSTDRLCKLRMGLGKPGSTVEYEVGKIVYYNKRTQAVSDRRSRAIGLWGKFVRLIISLFEPDGYEDINDVVIEVAEPKRLEPYLFIVGDFINALSPSPVERAILENNFRVALMRQVKGTIFRQELDIANAGVIIALKLEQSVKDGTYQ